MRAFRRQGGTPAGTFGVVIGSSSDDNRHHHSDDNFDGRRKSKVSLPNQLEEN